MAARVRGTAHRLVPVPLRRLFTRGVQIHRQCMDAATHQCGQLLIDQAMALKARESVERSAYHQNAKMGARERSRVAGVRRTLILDFQLERP